MTRPDASDARSTGDFLRALADQPLVGVYLIQDGRIRFANEKLARILGYERDQLLSGPSVAEVLHDDDRPLVLERLERLRGPDDSFNHQFRLVRKDGRAVPVEAWGRGGEWDGAPAVAGIIVDQSSHEVLARQLRRSQRLESLGEFTGVVAHDFNNVLTAIIAPVQLLLEDMDADDPLHEHLGEIELAAERGAALSRQLLAFSRKQVVRPHPIDLNECVEGVRPMLERLVGSAVSLETALQPGLRTVLMDVTQVEQILLNLVVNARDAMPNGGTVRISTVNVDPARDRVRGDPGLAPDGYVSLTVSDTGHGFDDEVRGRIFDPYFTTKSEGTGLGLSTVFGIASQAGGFVRVESGPGEGATFKIYLPAVDRSPRPVSAPPEPPKARPSGRAERILVVEDQDPVRHVIVRTLRRFGYEVISAGTGEEAVAQAGESPPDLILTDVMVPGMSGPEIAASLREDDPSMKVLFMSGYADNDMFRDPRLGEDWHLLAKPFSVDELLAAVSRAIRGSTPPARAEGG